MVIYTPIHNYPIPEMDDEPDGVGQLEALGSAVEGTLATPDIQTWVPVWGSSGSPKPTNPSEITGRYTLFQGWCDFALIMRMGGSSTGGAGQWNFTLPFPGGPITEQVVRGKLFEPQLANWQLHGLIYAGSNLLWAYVPRGGTTVDFNALQQRDPSNTPGTHSPTNDPGPLQAGGNVVFTGRYLVA